MVLYRTGPALTRQPFLWNLSAAALLILRNRTCPRTRGSSPDEALPAPTPAGLRLIVRNRRVEVAIDSMRCPKAALDPSPGRLTNSDRRWLRPV